jgi:hypothetical protein
VALILLYVIDVRPSLAETPPLYSLRRSPPRLIASDPADARGTDAWRGDERIARALYLAQTRTASTASAQRRVERRTLAEIVAIGGAGRGWNLAFKQLKSEGLIEEQTLGQVMARWAQRSAATLAASSNRRAEPRTSPSLAPSRTGS